MEVENNGNVIFAPSYIKVDQEEMKNIKNEQSINASSMLTYSKIVCCICGITMDANSEGICEACAKKNIDITTGITKVGVVTYCRTCERYKRPPWMKIEKESQDMMNLCLSKLKGLNKVQLIDSSFVWTEPHSKEIKIKVTIQKEINKSLLSTSFIAEFKEDWTQCEDCKKTFTPHIWRAVVQLRQKVNHKRTFLFLEQVILKHKAQAKALSIKEHPEGVDFYFANRAQANSFSAFIHEYLPCQTKTSRQLISVDEKSNEEFSNYNEQINNLSENFLFKFTTKKYFVAPNGKKKRVKKKRKFKPDDIRKKIKARFHKTIKNIINENLKKAGSKELFDFLPQCFIGNVSKKTNSRCFELTYKELLSTNFLIELNKEDYRNSKVDQNKYLKNIRVLNYLEKNPEICKRSGFDLIQDRKYKDLLRIYFTSAQFENSLIQLKAEKESPEYIQEYIHRAKSYVSFYSNVKYTNDKKNETEEGKEDEDEVEKEEEEKDN